MFAKFAAIALFSLLSANAETHTVQVGMGGLTFTPATITAKAGDDVAFQFMAKNHSVTQSTFADPCKISTDGVDSGLQAIPMDKTSASGGSDMPTWTFTVSNETVPLWFYCKQKTPVSHCAMGMVFSINPTAEKSHDMFVANAKATNATAASGSAASGSASAGASATPASAQAAISQPNGARTIMTGGAASVLAVVGVVASLL